MIKKSVMGGKGSLTNSNNNMIAASVNAVK
jgi:hypothetical protein